MLAERRRGADAVDPDDEAEAAGTSCLHARDRVLHDDRPFRRRTDLPGCLDEDVRIRLPLEPDLFRDDPVDPRLEQVAQAGAFEDRFAVLARRCDGNPDPFLPQPPDEGDRPLVDLDPLLLEDLSEESVLPVPETPRRRLVRAVVRSALGQLDPPRREEALHSLDPRLPVHVGVVVAYRVKRNERIPGLLRSLLEHFVEQPLPRRRVNRRGQRHHPVQIEDDGVYQPVNPHSAPSLSFVSRCYLPFIVHARFDAATSTTVRPAPFVRHPSRLPLRTLPLFSQNRDTDRWTRLGR